MNTIRNLARAIKNLLIKEQKEILSAAAVLILITVMTKVMGMLFLTFVTREFGASEVTDMYYLASVIPETITNIILLGVVSGSIIPIFIRILENDGTKRFAQSFNSVFNVSMLFFVFLSIIAALFSRQLIPFAFNLAQKDTLMDEIQINQVVWMMRILLIPQIILGFSAFISTWLNIYQRFIIPQLAPLFFNIGKIIGILVIVPLMNGNIWGLVWGSVVGAVLHLLIQLPLLKTLKFSFSLNINFKDRNFLQVLKMGLPRIISLSMEQFAVIIDSIIALGLTIGSLTAYQLAVRLTSLPLNLFGMSYAIASFPTFARLYAKGKKVEFSELFFKIINQIIYLSLPVSVIFIVMRVPIVRLVYGIWGGNFTWEDTLLVAWTVLFFSLGLVFEGLRSAIFRVYFAIHNTWIPMLSSFFVVTMGITTGILFSNYFSHFNSITLSKIYFDPSLFFVRGDGLTGASGLALSSSLVFSLEFFFLLFILVKKRVLINSKMFLKNLAKKLLAALMMLAVCYILVKLWDSILNTTKTFQLIFLSITTILSAVMVYIWASYLLKIEEIEIFMNLFLRNAKKLAHKLRKWKPLASHPGEQIPPF